MPDAPEGPPRRASGTSTRAGRATTNASGATSATGASGATRTGQAPRTGQAGRTTRTSRADAPAARQRAAEQGQRAAERGQRGQRASQVRTQPSSPGQPRPPMRPSRRRVLVRRSVAVLVVLGLIGVGLAVWFTPLLGVRNVAVSGTQALSTDQVVGAARVNPGSPMLRLSTADIAARVATLPRVASADVFREWPETVRIVVTERIATTVLDAPNGVHLVDRTGFDFATVPIAPPGLPKLTLPAASPADPRTQAVEGVLATLPAQLRAQLVSIGANTPGDVRFLLADGKTVVWGGTEDADRKGAVLAVLLSRPGQTYDVSSPYLPTVS